MNKYEIMFILKSNDVDTTKCNTVSSLRQAVLYKKIAKEICERRKTKLIKTTKKNKVKIKKLPIIVFGITTILLIAVIIYIIVK